jgi:thiamine-phosphate pyrophosphorylase
VPPRLPPLHVVTDDEVLRSADFLKRAGAVLRAGGEHVALHLRGPSSAGRFLFELAVALRAAAEESGALLLVNDRVDIALAAGAHGVQLGARAMSAADARRLLGPERLLGASVHSVAEAAAAAPRADFFLVGTVYASASHPGRAGAGPGFLRSLAEHGLPRIGIGGITAGRVAEVRAAGAAGVAVLRSVWNAADPAGATEELVRSWQNQW